MEQLLMSTLMILSGIACAFLVFGLIWILISSFASRDILDADSNKRWPPIDDDEFIRRCRPGVNRDIALRVRRVVSEQLGIPYEQIYPEQNFVRDLGCD